MDRSLEAESWPTLADFWCDPRKFVGIVATLFLTSTMHEQGLIGHVYGPVRYFWCSYDGFVPVEVLDELGNGELGLGLNPEKLSCGFSYSFR